MVGRLLCWLLPDGHTRLVGAVVCGKSLCETPGHWQYRCARCRADVSLDWLS